MLVVRLSLVWGLTSVNKHEMLRDTSWAVTSLWGFEALDGLPWTLGQDA